MIDLILAQWGVISANALLFLVVVALTASVSIAATRALMGGALDTARERLAQSQDEVRRLKERQHENVAEVLPVPPTAYATGEGGAHKAADEDIDSLSERILVLMSEAQDQAYEVQALAEAMGEHPVKIEHSLTELVAAGYLYDRLYTMRPTQYLLDGRGRAHLVRQGILD